MASGTGSSLKQRLLESVILVWSCQVLSPAVLAVQPEYLAEEPVPDSVKDLLGPIGAGLVPEIIGIEPAPPKPRKWPPFFSETELDLEPRTYYLETQRDETADSQAWALGGAVAYRSGWWRDFTRVGATLYTSQKLYGPEDKDGSLLLKPGQEGFTVLGQAFLETRLGEQLRLRLFRQTFELPYVNGNDTRMVPNTFEAYTLSEKADRLKYVLGHITKIKELDSSRFIYMSEAAGAKGTDKGLSMLGARYALTPHINLGAIDYYSWDVMNIFYAEANGAWDLADSLAIRISGQYTDQRSIGEERIGPFKTHVAGFKLGLSYGGGIVSLAYTSTGEDSGIRSPYGGYPGYLSLMLSDFNRAGEEGVLMGISYDFAHIGWNGLSGFINYAKGNTADSGTTASPDQEELDITFDYRPDRGWWRGFWLRARVALLDQEGPGAEDLVQYRIILNYSLPVL